MSHTQSSLINQMAAKPETIPPHENNPAETFKTMSTPVATIRVVEEVKTFSTHEYPNTFIHVNVKTNGIGEVKTLGRRSPKNFENEIFASEKIAESGLDGNMTLGETFPTIFEDDKFDFDNYTLSDVIKFLKNSQRS